MKNLTITVQAPGRINIIGEHTDYNNGFVLPAAIDKKTVVQLKLNETAHLCRFYAKNVNQKFEFNLTDFQRINEGWENYVMGIVSELQKLGATFFGFDCEFEGNVPIGSGMSSSAALECSLAYGLNELFNLGFDKWQLIKASQMAEHHFVGIQCGIMDQFASVMGKKNQVMLLDCQSLEFEYFPFDLGEYQLLLLDTNVSHTLAASEYNTRRQECEMGVAVLRKYFPEVRSLREATMDKLTFVLDELPNKIFNRCRHIVLENERVKAATKAMVAKDFQVLGQLLYESHDSLQHDYEVSCPELDFLAHWTQDKPYILGSRMMGGGFGGCTINIIEKKWVKEFITEISNCYKKHFSMDLTHYEVSIENGASTINNLT